MSQKPALNISVNKNNIFIDTLDKASDFVNRISITMIVLLLIAMTIIVLAQVFGRFILSKSISWAEEISRYLMIWICFMGSAVAVKEGEHIGVNFVIKKFSDRTQVIIGFIIKLCILFFLLFATWRGIMMTEYVINQRAPASLISMAWAYSAIPVGCFLMSIHTFLYLFTNPKRVGVSSNI